MSKYTIQAWNQPAGPGRGWARCTERKAELFFVFDVDGVRLADFKTRAAAQRFVKTNPPSNAEHAAFFWGS